jgi:L-cysteine desulfidase
MSELNGIKPGSGSNERGIHFTVKDILHIEVAPALGCTEPTAIALGAAAAASLLPGNEIDLIEIWVDPNIYKNGLAVAIPGAQGLSGLDMATALGALGGDANLGMEVLHPIDDQKLRQAQALIAGGKVKVNLLKDHRGLHIRTVIRSGPDVAESVIRDLHNNIVLLSLNGEELRGHPLISAPKEGEKKDLAGLEKWLTDLSLQQLLDLIDDLDDEDLAFIEEGLRLNLRLARYGLKHGPGLGIGKALERLANQRLLKRDMVLEARILTSAAADTRMAGVKLPAMSSAGSGNHGLTAILPIQAVRDYIDCDDRTVLKAIGFSHIVTAYIKAFTGRLSAVCGCAVAAGVGAAAGVTYLLGGDIRHISGAIKNLTQELAGVICDGAKAGCALKLSTAAGAAVQAALFALQGVTVMPTDGIIGVSSEQTIRNIGELATEGMVETDRTILNIMLEKQFAGS